VLGGGNGGRKLKAVCSVGQLFHQEAEASQDLGSPGSQQIKLVFVLVEKICGLDRVTENPASRSTSVMLSRRSWSSSTTMISVMLFFCRSGEGQGNGGAAPGRWLFS
jgi:hypothetical protein